MAKPTPEQRARFEALIEAGMITNGPFERLLRHHEGRWRRLQAASAPPPVPAPPLMATPEQRAVRARLDLAGSEYPDLLIPHVKGDKLGTCIRNLLWNFSLYRANTKMYVTSIRELVAVTEREALKVKDFGPKIVAILQERLAFAALRLGMTTSEIDEAFGPKPAFAPDRAFAKFQQELDRAGIEYPDLLIRSSDAASMKALRLLEAMQVHNKVRLPEPLYGRTTRLVSIRQLIRIRKREFLKIVGVGKEVTDCVEEALAVAGLRLGMGDNEIEAIFHPGLPLAAPNDTAAAAS